MDEKKPVIAEKPPLVMQPPKRKVFTTLLALVAALSVVAFFHQRPLETDRERVLGKEPAGQWTWNDVTPSRDLAWEKCYDGKFDCARLDVPMDWLEPAGNKTVRLGVLRLAAKSSDKKLSPVFVNPGGPGGSGVQFLRQAGHLIQTIVGDNHDIISWDPRGVGVSTPRVECWGSSQKRKAWSLQETPVVDERPGLEYDAYSRAFAYSGACEAAMDHTGLMSHLGTPSHARDMLEILKKTGHEKLRYWGFSYGTVLGGVFAALFPEKVERMVSDGNCDYHDWFKLDHTQFLVDTDKILDAFDKACHEGGPDKCALWAQSAEAVQNRRAALLEKLKISPVIVPAWTLPSGPELPEVITYSKLQRLMQTMLYRPQKALLHMARIYEALERGDGLPYWNKVREPDDEDETPKDSCSLGETPATLPQETGAEPDAFPAIMCSDNEQATDTPAEFSEYVKGMLKTSRWAGAVNLYFHVLCLGRKVRPKWKFDEATIQGETAHPILFIGNMADNVTPFQSAVKNSARFPGSVVLKQNSYGHCSLAAASTCTARHVRAYFQHGTLPPPGTECDPDYGLLDLPSDQQVNAEDDLASAVLKLTHKAHIPRGFV
ncbi:TAP-like protein-domain-containing protein [Thelonectria olida]|uniref:TAP-like protein-domain-containing protein n=1 Tax=Thelonectria olida TaxID=1576542 RepID=A0A9P9ARZ2_9HYPO|nr:TAP-like protein-domain-containing protein [Thelonectria olida]